MKLTFLGCPYEANTTEIETVPAEQTGMYRGNPVQISTGRVALRATKQLTYRGITYSG